MSYVMVDIEADGPIPGDYSMVCFGAVIVEPTLNRTFYAALAPSSQKWVPEALRISGFSREDTFAQLTRGRRSLDQNMPALDSMAALSQ